MKIALINSEWLPVPPVMGGAIEQTLYETALAIRDPKTVVISPHADALETISYPSDIFFHIPIDTYKNAITKKLGSTLPADLKNPSKAQYFYYLNGVTELLQDLDPDVIQIHNRANFVPYLKKQFPNKKFIVYMHNQARFRGGQLGEAIQDIDHLICVSQSLAKQYTTQFPQYTSKTHVIYNSVDTQIWHPKHKKSKQTQKLRQKYHLHPNNTVLFVGRTIPEKGIDVLIDAIDIVRHQLPNIKLLIAGTPFYRAVTHDPFLSKLKKRAKKLKDHIIFLDYVEHNQTPYLYAAADITVSASLWDEPFGKVIVESMAAGTPVIGSCRGAIPELIDHNINGIVLQNPEDKITVAQAIQNLLLDSNHQKKMGSQARIKAIDKFSKKQRIKQLRHFYQTL